MLKRLAHFLWQHRINPIANFHRGMHINKTRRESMLYTYDLAGLHAYHSAKMRD